MTSIRTSLTAFLAIVLIALPLHAQDPEQGTSDLPSAREIFDRFVEVTNMDRVAGETSRKLIGSFSIPAQGLDGQMTVYSKVPNLYYSEVVVPGVGKLREGFDGTTVWELNPLTGPSILEGDAREQKIVMGSFHLSYYRPEDIETAEVVGVSTFQGEEAYEIDLTRKGGMRSKEYFSVQTGYAIGSTMEVVHPMGTFPARTVLGRYEEIDGVFVPTQSTVSVMGTQQVLLFDDVEYGDFDDSVFDLPPEIAAMIED